MKKIIVLIFMLTCLNNSYAAKVYNADVVVVGAGGSGNAAAVQAAQLGAKVIVLEKQAAAGGNANFCEGIFGADSKFQRSQNLPNVSKEDLFNKIMDFNHYKGDPLLVSAFVNQSADTIEWLQSLGVKIDGVFLEADSRTYTWHRFNGLCRAMTETLIKSYPKYGIQLMLETEAKDVIMKDGKAVGVKAFNVEDGDIVINAKAVIIGTGGFVSNAEMLKKYADFKGPITAIGAKNRTGDGIRMALAAGAKPEGLGTVQYHSPSPRFAGFAGIERRKTGFGFNQPVLWVNSFGKRFVNEYEVRNFSIAGNAAVRQKNGLVIKLLDSAVIDQYEKEGLDFVGGVNPRVPFTNLLRDIEADVQAGNVVKANTIEDLAKQLNKKFGTEIDPKILQATVDQTNHAYDKNFDDLFFKPRKVLHSFRTPPYYAIATYPAALGTVGGIRVDENCQAVDNDFHPIPGLFVVGADAGGMYGDTYDIIVAGETIGFAVNSGRLAAKHAVATYVK
ncbi:FAD-dependent oxidoreductase [Seleniivibrio sp.]|uniref:FAD-dependent oxidoreductase n=1 Tax=Seleniivibrio sp. TaxID=2898801 RepID=UPI0025FAF92E|nr:FAD-dependent oxidoreductase [Seleniivibrio sp.]MCD8553514.1 FAD-dependent oxidoreductase [Seleniivibrio sp.]